MDNERFVRLEDVILMVGLSKSEIHRQMKEGRFPASRKYASNSKIKFWLLSEIRTWMRRVIDGGDDYLDTLGLR